MIKKMEHFVASLTDQEIDCQLKDIFEWVRVYKDLLETEQSYRRSNRTFTSGNSSTSSLNVDNDYEAPEEDYEYDGAVEINFDEISVDFELAQMIQQKVSTFSVEKTREQIEKLKQIPTHTLTPKDLAQRQYVIETCELHLFELTGETTDGSNVCPSCGTELEAHAKFCGKCGTAIKGV